MKTLRAGRSRASRWQHVVGLVVLVGLAGWAFAASAPEDEIPAGIDEKEYDRLARPTAFRRVPEFLSPEALAGLSDKVVEAIQRDFAERGRIQVQSDRYLDFDEKRNTIYSNARTRIRFDQYMLEADRVLVHVPLQEIQAEGNVILQAWRDPNLTIKSDEIHCDSIIFNYKYFQGAAYKVRGQHDVLHFKATSSESELPAFRMVGRDEVVLRDVEFTTCDFPTPQYHVQTEDGILVFDDRIFMRNAKVYLRNILVFVLPAYTRSLRETSPWHVTFGRSSDLGTYVNVRYNYYHYRYEPSFEDEDEMELRDRGHAEAKLDFFSDRGVAAGLAYDYKFDSEKHRGRVELYGMPSDRERDVEDDNEARWQVYAQHRSQLTDNLILQADVDYVSDPEFYYDLFDPIEVVERGRLPERRARTALTWWKEDYIARMLLEVKERITRDRITNTLEPGDDDFDYTIDLTAPEIDDPDHGEGISSDRYQIVSARLPQLTFSTNHLRLANASPLFYSVDVSAFNNLDKGLNFGASSDDSFVLGLDVYQQLSYLIRFSKRYTLLAQVGLGLGIMQRLDDSYGWEPEDFLRENAEGVLRLRKDIKFVDDSTFLAADGNREVSLDDYQPGFVYGDAKLRFRGRFTDSLTGNLYWMFREGTDNSLSEFYESIGNKTARPELYNYRIRKHWITGDLGYRLSYPDLLVVLAAGRNLQSKSDIYANEPIQYATLSARYRNQARTFRTQGVIGYYQTQIRDPSDPLEYQRDSISASIGAGYAPPHRRWWVEGSVFLWKALNTDPARRDDDRDLEEDFFRDLHGDDDDYWDTRRFDDTDIIVEVWYGRKFGEKWIVEIGAEYDNTFSDIREAELILTRNLHNAIAQLRARYRNRPWRRDDDTDININVSIQFKLPGPMESVRAPRAATLMTERRKMLIAEGDPLGG